MGARPDITMTADEIVAFLQTQSRGVVAALDGTTPVGTVADVRLVGRDLEVTLARDDPVRSALAVDDRVCVIVEQFPTYHEIRCVSAHGRAVPVDGPGGRAFRVDLDDVTSFDFGKLPRTGAGSGTSR